MSSCYSCRQCTLRHIGQGGARLVGRERGGSLLASPRSSRRAGDSNRRQTDEQGTAAENNKWRRDGATTYACLLPRSRSRSLARNRIDRSPPLLSQCLRAEIELTPFASLVLCTQPHLIFSRAIGTCLPPIHCASASSLRSLSHLLAMSASSASAAAKSRAERAC